jgi:molecular chaperone DnaK (HSP70)
MKIFRLITTTSVVVLFFFFFFQNENLIFARAVSGGVGQQPCIGISLGDSKTVAAFFNQSSKQTEIIPNLATNESFFPSIITFLENGEVVIGEATTEKQKNSFVISSVKRLIGLRFKEKSVQDDIAAGLFPPSSIVHGKNGFAMIQVSNSKAFLPEEITAMILKKVKDNAETFLGKTVENALLSVPIYFSDAQRQATKDAGTIAELNVLRILNEPTAATIAYGLDRKAGVERDILVFGLGGRAFDVSIFEIDEGFFELIGRAGSTSIGGDDFDNRLIDFIVKSHSSKTFTRSNLRSACRLAKHELSSKTETTIQIGDSTGGLTNIITNITRQLFEEMNQDYFDRAIQLVEQALSEAKLNKSSIQGVVLVGGSTKIPKIRQMISDFFSSVDGEEGTEFKKRKSIIVEPDQDSVPGVDAENAIALGTARQGAIMSGDEVLFAPLFGPDWVEHSIGYEINGVMKKVINRNSFIPTKKTEIFTTYQDNDEDPRGAPAQDSVGAWGAQGASERRHRQAENGAAVARSGGFRFQFKF